MKSFKEYLEIIQESNKPEKLTNKGDSNIIKRNFVFFINTKEYYGTLLYMKQQMKKILNNGYSISTITINGISREDFIEYLKNNPDDYFSSSLKKNTNIEESPKGVIAITFIGYSHHPNFFYHPDLPYNKPIKKHNDIEREDNEDNPASYS